MIQDEVTALWESNAPAWTRLSRAGYDVLRDRLNTPAFLALLPDVRDLDVLDVGCGEGHTARLVADRGARVTAVDVAATFIRLAAAHERAEPRGVRYVRASADALPFADASFDAVVSTMALMDMPDHASVVREAQRVLRPGGVFQFSILHPCFHTRRWAWVHDAQGARTGVVCGDYFDPPHGELDEFTFGAAPPEARAGAPPFRVPRFYRTLSGWLNLLLETGFAIERVEEPAPPRPAAGERAVLPDARCIAWVLLVRCRSTRSTDAGGYGPVVDRAARAR